MIVLHAKPVAVRIGPRHVIIIIAVIAYGSAGAVIHLLVVQKIKEHGPLAVFGKNVPIFNAEFFAPSGHEIGIKGGIGTVTDGPKKRLRILKTLSVRGAYLGGQGGLFGA